MTRIKGKNTAPEVFVRKYLWRAGLRYRLHTRGLPGKPDLVLKRWDAVVFVNGCFWHRHEGCPLFRLPKTRSDFWDQKLRGNQIRDSKAIAALSGAGWRVCVVWECALRTAAEESCSQLVDWIRCGDTNTVLAAAGQSALQLPLAPDA